MLGDVLAQIVCVEQQFLKIDHATEQKETKIKINMADDDLVIEHKILWKKISDIENEIIKIEAKKSFKLAKRASGELEEVLEPFASWNPIKIFETMVAARSITRPIVHRLRGECVKLLEELTEIERGLAAFALEDEALNEKANKNLLECYVLADRMAIRIHIMLVKKQLDEIVSSKEKTEMINQGKKINHQDQNINTLGTVKAPSSFIE